MFKICIGRNKGFERFLLTTPAAIVERRRTEPPERPVTASQNEDVIAATAPPENNNPQVAVDGIPVIPAIAPAQIARRRLTESVRSLPFGVRGRKRTSASTLFVIQVQPTLN